MFVKTLDLDPVPLWPIMLDPDTDPHWNQCGSETLDVSFTFLLRDGADRPTVPVIPKLKKEAETPPQRRRSKGEMKEFPGFLTTTGNYSLCYSSSLDPELFLTSQKRIQILSDHFYIKNVLLRHFVCDIEQFCRWLICTIPVKCLRKVLPQP
jgi:hypothetical protein